MRKKTLFDKVLCWAFLITGILSGWYAIQLNDVLFGLLCMFAFVQLHRIEEH